MISATSLINNNDHPRYAAPQCTRQHGPAPVSAPGHQGQSCAPTCATPFRKGAAGEPALGAAAP
eukprot:scaffold6129_cov147-Isochrysis_galbana.AAC.4